MDTLDTKMRHKNGMCIKRKKVTEHLKIKKLLSHEKERKNILLYYCYNYNAYFEKSIDHTVVVVKCFSITAWNFLLRQLKCDSVSENHSQPLIKRSYQTILSELQFVCQCICVRSSKEEKKLVLVSVKVSNNRPALESL